MSILLELARCFLPSHEAFIFMWLLAAMGICALVISAERWFNIRRRTDYDAPRLFTRVRNLLEERRSDEAIRICGAGRSRALPRILESGLRKAVTTPGLAADAMSEESTAMASILERRLGYLVMLSNAATLLGLLGTVFGLIMSFAAVGKPGVAAIEKSSLLAAGISTAMNSTLVGLTISILCVISYTFLRTRVDAAIAEIDRYAIAILNLLAPPSTEESERPTLVRRSRGEEDVPDTDVTPMLNLMVMLIPFLLTSSEFVKIGTLELKLPSASGGSGGGGGESIRENVKLDLGLLITAKGFTLFHYFKSEQGTVNPATATPDIPLTPKGEYDYDALGKALAGVKRRALLQILPAYSISAPDNASLPDLAGRVERAAAGAPPSFFEDYESIKIVAEEKIEYQTIISVMDAARGIRLPQGNVTLFPNVSIAAGVF